MKIRYPELDALRGIAAIFVAVYHFTLGQTHPLLQFRVGATGVELFFIISGFVIFMSINHVATAREFIIRRFTRLYPTYWTCVTITFIVTVLAQLSYKAIDLSLWKTYALNLTMLQHYSWVDNLDGSYWTLIIELLFYLVIVLLFILKQLKHIEVWGGISVFVVGIYNFFVPTSHQGAFRSERIDFPLVNYLPLFFMGILFFTIIHEKKDYVRRYILIGLCWLVQFSLFYQSVRYDLFKTQWLYGLVLLGYVGVFTLFVTGKLKWIVNPVTLFFGKISYAFYLIHQFIGVYVLMPKIIAYFGISLSLASLIAFSSMVLLASFITFFVEIPARTKLNASLLSNKKSSPTYLESQV
ncbi:acyltransferase family protein [Xanthocytophaga flava]|uniref:acyltransferase family protein n=1 Tax=Xanthocytophaga flava TaxID=3048013 RepID=UPI0028D4E9D1|nr:acyltransferase [Xanthocytophaga flavus]MDJ1466476.1 acyltransferase [Xanthocytophaga flavus]